MKLITLYEIHEWDGADRHNFSDMAFDNRAAADNYKKNVDPVCMILERKTTVFESVSDYRENTDQKNKGKSIGQTDARRTPRAWLVNQFSEAFAVWMISD